MARYLESQSGLLSGAARYPAVDAAARVAKAVVDILIGWQARAFERSRLAQLDRRMVEDMGLDPDFVRRESAKPFWRV